MKTTRPPKLVLLGFLSHFPVAGVAWQTVHYLIGFQRLGYEVYYVEAHGCTPSKLMRSETDDGARRAAEYIGSVMRRFGLDGRWAYRPIYESRCFGLSETQLKDLYREAALLINLHGSHLPVRELTATNRLVYVGTDPVDIELEVFGKNQQAIDYLKPHCAFFTYGENLGRPGCLVPNPEPFQFRPTRQPVVMEFWEGEGRGDGAVFTTIGNWRQPWREAHFNGQVYRWSKHFEFLKFIDLPGRVRQPFELALSSASHTAPEKRLLESKGWRVRDALDFSHDLDAYRRYIGGSRGEFTVAKDQNIRLRSGWFSDRAATYLAAGRPVITQETGFSNGLPAGRGLFAFSTMDEIVGAVESVNADYEGHRHASWMIAREYFSHEVVLGRMLGDLGLRRAARSAAGIAPERTGLPLPLSLVLSPVSRWPTRLPKETLQTALALPVPAMDGPWSGWTTVRQSSALPEGPASRTPGRSAAGADDRAAVIILTRGGLAYTKLCLTTLLHHWTPGDELLIVDNASTDGTREFLRELAACQRFIKVIFNETNRGFAAGNNQALELTRSEVLILLNNDTLVLPSWRDVLAGWLADHSIGLVGPVTNRACNEAQIDAPYRTYAELTEFAARHTAKHAGQANDIRMAAMFCVAMRREVFERVGPLDEQFKIGMFEDDDYAEQVRRAGWRVVCAEDVFIHHFGQAALGELCATGDYDRILEANRRRYEAKWGVPWQPHARRITTEYRELRERIRARSGALLPPAATVAVISKGDDELLKLGPPPSALHPRPGVQGWHFPQAADGSYANRYPADSADAIAQLESIRAKGANFLLVPKPAFWWLDHYADLGRHLERHYQMAARDDATCLLFDLEGNHV